MILMVAFHVWLQRKSVKNLLKTLFLLAFLTCSSLFVVTVAAEEPVLLLLADYQWAHISIDGSPTESFRFERIGSDVQAYFFAFNDSSTVYDQFIINPNETFTDPLRMLMLHWNGTGADKLLFTLASVSNKPLSLVTSKFEAKTIVIGHPPMTYLKSLITMPTENQTQLIYDVLLDNEWLVSFDWTWTTFENQTLPQLRIYSTDGTIRDTRLFTAEMMPLVDYGGVDGVGWIPQSLTTLYVKWLLYSGHELTVRPNVGFGQGKPLPSFQVEPTSSKVEPNWLISIRFTLPEGITNYTTNLEGYQKYINQPISKPSYNSQTKEYTISWSFSNNAQGRAFTITVQTMKHGIVYTSETRLQVIQPTWQNTAWAAAAGSVVIFVAVFVLIIVLKTKRVKPTATEAVFNPLR